MKYIMYFTLCLVLFSSCASVKLEKTVWYNVSPAELNGEKGNVVTTLYFLDKNTVSFNTSVKQDTNLIVKPAFTAYGKYSVKGKVKKGAKITVNAVELTGDSVTYKGVIIPDGMVLVSPDSIAKAYNMASNLTLKQ